MTSKEELKENPELEVTNTDDEIDLIALAKTLWEGRRTIIRSVAICAILGVLIALLSHNEYTASTTIVPQIGNRQSAKLGGLSSLASMAGINLNQMDNSESLSPFVYPRIIESLPFQLELMNTTFNCPNVDQPVSLYDYYTEYKKPGFLGSLKKYTIGLPGVIIGAIKGKQPVTTNDSMTTNDLLKLTNKQESVRKQLSNQISLELNEKEGFIILNSHFGDASLAAQVAQKAQTMLQEYITKYKIEKASQQLTFITDRYNEKKAAFEEVQHKLASFRDRNRNVTTALAKTEEEQLLSQYNIAYTVYSELAKQLEQAQIQVKEDTPVLTIIDPVRVPAEKSAPRRSMILFVWIFLGGVIGVGLVFGRQFMSTVKQRWGE